MEIILKLTPYRKFLIAFREADKANPAGTETPVTFESSMGTITYYYQSPNFKLIAYDTGGGRVNLTDYNHTALSTSKDLASLTSDFTNAGGGGTRMTSGLSTVVAATSEAARSKVVEEAIKKIIGGTAVNLHNYDVLFKAYSQPAKYNGLLANNGDYNNSWRPLTKEDYLHFFNSDTYTGDKPGMRSALSGL